MYNFIFILVMRTFLLYYLMTTEPKLSQNTAKYTELGIYYLVVMLNH